MYDGLLLILGFYHILSKNHPGAKEEKENDEIQAKKKIASFTKTDVIVMGTKALHVAGMNIAQSTHLCQDM